MNRPVKTMVVVAGSLSLLGMLWISQRAGAAMERTVPTTPAATAAAEHIAEMAMSGDVHAGHAMDEMAAPELQAAPANAKLPPDDAGAKARLDSSPRKSEFVKIDVNGTPMRAFVVYPARTDKAPVVVVIQEIFGLADWIRGVADQLAADGFIAIAPDLLAGRGPNGGDSTAFSSQQETTQATLGLPPAEILDKLKAARAYGVKLPQSNGKSASIGFCFGGSQSFAFAVNDPALNATVVYYGTAPTDVPSAARGAQPGGPPPAFVPSDKLANTKAPVLGLYGGADARVNSTIAATEQKMKQLGKTYEPHVFDGAAHGFLRAQTGNDGANMKATETAWPLTLAWIRKYTS